jgi:hypothetical protein
VDFLGHAHIDLLVANLDDNSVSVLPGLGDGTFQAKQDLTTGKQPTSLVVGDFNGDARPDVAVADFGAATVTVLVQCAQ